MRSGFWPGDSLAEAAHAAVAPALDGTAGLFNNLVSTFPLAALAAVLLWVNWHGCQGVLLRALRKRFGWLGCLVHLFVLLCAAAALAKPTLYFTIPPLRPALWVQWAPVIAWLGFLFEYMVGVGVQIYLILVAYCWMRGLTFTHQHLSAMAIRRFSSVARWAGVVMFLSSAFIDLPLTLRNFPAFADFLPASFEAFESRIALMRQALDAVLLLFATLQITLTFHSESLGCGLLDHFRFVRRHGWALCWLIIIAALHFYGLHLADLLVVRGFGSGTAPALIWTLLFPWLTAFLGAWLLASWVAIYRRSEGRLAQSDTLTRF